ncbi:WW-domain-binding protein [Niveomyces insectorum RCEF 264]|uniref:WW-domain-binding protein n=1 Tax=Niveomyces insectorum RCEF 264 TaxID=1081102 RepID=A0A167SE92_9HYPO|nr:WW-domain-binding protein [Niveomyces insectorum RCEF 264]
MDFYQEQHSFALARTASRYEDDSDEDTSWVMMNREGEVVKLPGEKIYYKVRSRIGLDLTTPKSLPNAPPFSVKSDSGTVYVTNNRVIYLPVRPTDTFKSFSAPILDFEDTRVTSSFFGPWSWNGIVKPTLGGGLPANLPRLDVKLTFKEGGHDAFQSKFEVMKERLNYARTLQQETGQIIPTGEDLPRYEATASGSVQGGPGPSQPQVAAELSALETPPSHPRSDAKELEALEHFAQSHAEPTSGTASTGSNAYLQVTAAEGRTSTGTPDEPPPDYEEAQAQAVGNRVEERLREAADTQ